MDRTWKHFANSKRIVGSDFDRIAYMQSCIPTGYSALQYQILRTKKGKYQKRKPDLTIKICGFTVPIELDGGVHGFNDEISETEQTKIRNNDYVRQGHLPIIINHEQLKEMKIPEEMFIKCAIVLLEPIFRAKRRLALEKLK